PQLGPGRALEVERIHVLVDLGRVLGTPDRPVGPLAEPFGVLAHPRVVGGSLEGDVDGQGDPVGVGSAGQATHVLDGAELRVHRRVPTFGRPDGPGAAVVVRAADRCVVRTLA